MTYQFPQIPQENMHLSSVKIGSKLQFHIKHTVEIHSIYTGYIKQPIKSRSMNDINLSERCIASDTYQ